MKLENKQNITGSDTFGEQVIKFYSNLYIDIPLPDGVAVLRPFDNAVSAEIAGQFYRKFYNDNASRTFIIGINPGRFGGGITGIPFTDPVKLIKHCGISNDFELKTELSADFIYQVIESCGGAERFYSRNYFTSMSPLGFTRNGINMNYYDDKELFLSLQPLMVTWLRDQLTFGSQRSRCICLGSGKNLKYLQKLNQEYSFFEQIDVLDHPRYIMQYKRKQLDEYIKLYKEALSA